MMLVFSLLVCVFTVSLVGSGLLSVLLRKRSVMDIPGDRSSHAVATPRGGGLAIIAAVLTGVVICLAANVSIETDMLVLLSGGIMLAMLSWVDDLRSLSPSLRFAGHAIVVALSIPFLGLNGPVLPFDPPLWLDRLLLGLAWLAFLNFFNFMDGIDGISVVETTVIGIGIVLLKVVIGTVGTDALIIALVVTATAGFMWWNWSPATLFMGDVGSVFLGYILGGYLILLAADGFLIAAFILPAYYLMDAVTTLVRRALRGERVWQAHRQHFYQRAVLAGRSHTSVSIAILLTGIGLIVLALTSISFPIAALLLATGLSAGLCAWLPRVGNKNAR